MIAIAQQINLVVDNFLNQSAPKISWNEPVADNRWSNKEIIGHLIDSAHVNLTRFVRCTYEDGFKVIYNQDVWVKAQHYQNANITDLLQLWRLLNRQIARVLSDFPAERLNATCDTGREEITCCTVEFLANDYLAHMRHHLTQINKPF